ncbi:MAG: cephalosporin hydroxylase family protein [Thermodesulfobacteriota bacterium]|nr:cephalosporin hydroxylase family protein [Thermodesulfobacteriota bacterium]
MNKVQQFAIERKQRIKNQGTDEVLLKSSKRFQTDTIRTKYSYNFTWMGQPIIQYPQDMVMMQEIIWKVQPDLIIETGIAHGGSLIFYASMLSLLNNGGHVLGIDIDIREHNRKLIDKHPMSMHITMFEGSSISQEIVARTHDLAKNKETILVVLDAMHTHDHVLEELNLYSPLVSKDSYLVVFDTIIEDLGDEFFQDRPWGVGNNPKTAVWEFLQTNDRFAIDKEIENKLLVTVAPDGYLKCLK